MASSEYLAPFQFFPDMEEHHLNDLSSEILKVVHATVKSHNTDWDDSYTFETSVFGRVRNLFIHLHEDKSRPWIKVVNKGMDYVPNIFGMPVRVFRDDPHSPQKQKVFIKNGSEQHQLALLFDEDNTAEAGQLTWRIFIQEPDELNLQSEDVEGMLNDYSVEFAGYNPLTKEVVSKWQSRSVIAKPLFEVGVDLPAAKAVQREIPVPRQKDEKSINE